MLLNERGFMEGLKGRADEGGSVATIEFKCKFGTTLPTDDEWG